MRALVQKWSSTNRFIGLALVILALLFGTSPCTRSLLLQADRFYLYTAGVEAPMTGQPCFLRLTQYGTQCNI